MRISLLAVIAALLITVSVSARSPWDEIKRLTWRFAPDHWKLHNVFPNPFSPTFSTEFAIPDTSLLRIDICREDTVSKALYPVRHMATPGDGPFVPAVYELDWWCTCDSFDLPETGSGIYRIRLDAYDPAAPDLLLHADTAVLIYFADGLRDIGDIIELIEITVLE